VKYVLATLLALCIPFGATAQDALEPEFVMYDYWGTMLSDGPGEIGGLAFTWVGAQDGALGEHPTPETSPGVLRIYYREDVGNTCTVDIEIEMRDYFPVFEYIELVVGGDQTFKLSRFYQNEEASETRARVGVDDTIPVLNAFRPAATARVIVTDWNGVELYNEVLPLIGFSDSTTAASSNCGSENN
jgi:hypothetical protein